MNHKFHTLILTRNLSRLLILGTGVVFVCFTLTSYFSTRHYLIRKAERYREMLIAELPEITDTLTHHTADLSKYDIYTRFQKRMNALTYQTSVGIVIAERNGSFPGHILFQTDNIPEKEKLSKEDKYIDTLVGATPCRIYLPLVDARLNDALFKLSIFDFSSSGFAILLLWLFISIATRRAARPLLEKETEEHRLLAKNEHELSVARSIQQDLIPQNFALFPERPGVEIFAQIIPSPQVGGDFYDCIKLDNAHLFIAAGDVEGSGVSAALMMVISQTILRNAVCKHRHPGYALTTVSQEIARRKNPIPVSIFCGILNIYTGVLTWANAGYNAPVIFAESGKLLETLDGDPVQAGAKSDFIFSRRTSRLNARELLWIISNGIKNAKDREQKPYTLSRVKTLVEINPDATLEQITELLFNDIENHIQSQPQEDDYTVLGVRSAYIIAHDPSIAPESARSLILPNQLSALTHLMEWTETQIEKHEIPMSFGMVLNLVLEEWFVNIVSYAFSDKAEHEIVVRLWINNGALWIQFEDDGTPYDPTARAEVDTDLPLEQRSIGGLGIHFIRQTMDIFHYTRRGNKNIVTLMKQTDLTLSERKSS